MKELLWPRGATPAYAFFVKGESNVQKKRDKEWVANFDMGNFSRGCAQKWKRMDGSQKQPFISLANKDTARAKKEMCKFEKSHGQRIKDINNKRRRNDYANSSRGRSRQRGSSRRRGSSKGRGNSRRRGNSSKRRGNSKRRGGSKKRSASRKSNRRR